jgi:class 3 adenylate cyclase
LGVEGWLGTAPTAAEAEVKVPETRYATSGRDHIAYQTLGEGSPALVMIRESHVSVLDLWDHPSSVYFHRRLAAFAKLLVFDVRGTGASDAYGVASRPTLETWVDDTRAVLKAEGCEQAVLFGAGDLSLVALTFAATYPSATLGVILFNGYARYYRDDGYEIGRERPASSSAERMMRAWGTTWMAERLSPSMMGDEVYRSWLVRSQRASAGPGSQAVIYENGHERDVRALLPAVRVPTLILHRRDSRYVALDHGRFLADHLPNASLVELPGADHTYYTGEDVDTLLSEIERFVRTKAALAPDETRALATVLFTDIVGSTKLAVSRGDRDWRALLDDHDTQARREVEQRRGKVVKHVGDGVIATFDGPARAIEAACSIIQATRKLGLDVKAGLHTGEVELRGDDIGGIAVHISARVAELAQGGEVLVSRTVKDLVAGSGIGFADRGAHTLKGIPDDWQLFAVDHGSFPGIAATH